MVAGGAGGIGTASCVRLATEGAKVCVGDIDEESLADVIAKVTAVGGEIEATGSTSAMKRRSRRRLQWHVGGLDRSTFSNAMGQ